MISDESYEPQFEKALDQEFFLRDPSLVAHDLVGKVIVRKLNGEYLSALITETEAYLHQGDLSCHAVNGKTLRNAPMFENGGILYVYKIYGIHHCINFVTEEAGKGSAVLIRSAKPLTGIQTMIKFRNSTDMKSLCRGPGNLAKAFGFTKEHNLLSLISPELYIQDHLQLESADISISERIGISKSKELKLRYFIKQSEFVSTIKKKDI